MGNAVSALAMPMRCGGMDPEAFARGTAAKATAGGLDICPGQAWTSLLPYTFNLLWTGFLGMRKAENIRYFAMVHDDIRPDRGWLDVLVSELEATGADVVSAVVPIKDDRGLTSTAVDDTGDEWNPRRLTLRQVFELPPTFGDAEASGPVLANTGLWVCRFDRPWVERVCFRQQDRIVRTPDGRFCPQTKPEDWDFSRQVRTLGGRVLVTRKVGLDHERPEFHNRSPWGAWDTDRDLDAPAGVVAKSVGR